MPAHLNNDASGVLNSTVKRLQVALRGAVHDIFSLMFAIISHVTSYLRTY